MRTPAGFYFIGGDGPVTYTKPALSIEQQIDHILACGMILPDREQAKRDLSHKNYYRLRAYWLPFEIKKPDDDTTYLLPGTNWPQIMHLYYFDRQLRTLLMDAIQTIEISSRTAWAYYLAVKYGPHAHENPDIFFKAEAHQQLLDKLREDYQDSQEVFAAHHREKYPELFTPPIWASCELMTLGQLSRWYGALKSTTDQKAIAKPYGLHESIMRSFLHHLTVVRNLCAHHGRVWNRTLVVTMKIPSDRNIAYLFNADAPQRIYNTIVMLSLLECAINPACTWAKEVKSFIEENREINLNAMGFPTDWQQRWEQHFEKI